MSAPGEDGASDGPVDWEATTNPAAASIEEFLAARYDSIPGSELAARQAYFARPVAVRGRVLGGDGAPLPDATVSIGEAFTRSDAAGRFELGGLTRQNRALSIERAGHRPHWAGLQLNVPLEVDWVELPDLRLTPSDPAVVRFLFGGDTSFGRRFLDPRERFGRHEMPEDDPDALIRVSDPLPGSRGVLARMAPLFRRVDFPVINLETVVTRAPVTPHQEKDFAYFSLPESLPALTELGVRYVSLGNNHVYDYLEQGIADTLANVTAAGLAHSGAGRTAEEAFLAHRVELGGHPYSFLSMSSVSGEQFAISYNATADKGGAADLRDDAAVRAAIQREAALGRHPIVQLHTGREYSFAPTGYVFDRLELVAAEKPALIIGHHPHVAQGFGFHGGVFAVHSLGNFLFDQLRLDTMLSMVVQIDLRAGELGAVRAIPIYIEDSVPRPLVGATAERLLRRLAELSAPHGARVLPEAGWGSVVRSGAAAAGAERAVTLEVEVPEQGWTIVDLRGVQRPSESVAHVELALGTSGRLGRDILEGHGDFEDIDVDDELYEISRWDVTGASAFPCLSRVYRGTAGLCSVRRAAHQSDSVIPLRNRVRVVGDSEHAPNKSLSLLAYHRGENAGAVRIKASYHASVGEREFGEAIVFERAGGSYDWEPLRVDLALPPDDPAHPQSYEENARALRIFLRQSPPSEGEALWAVDDVAIVNWDLPLEGTRAEVSTPHARDFLRLEGAPGRYAVGLRFREP